VFGQAININFSNRPWPIRAGTNIAYVGACLSLTFFIRGMLSIP
jgi:hypothetical protein